MNDSQVKQQIQQMVSFIRQEAEEKAAEIGVKAEEDFNIRKLSAVEAAREKIRAEYERKTKLIQVNRKMYVLWGRRMSEEKMGMCVVWRGRQTLSYWGQLLTRTVDDVCLFLLSLGVGPRRALLNVSLAFLHILYGNLLCRSHRCACAIDVSSCPFVPRWPPLSSRSAQCPLDGAQRRAAQGPQGP